MFLKSQRNSLSTAIREQGLNLRDFSLKEDTELRVTHIQSEYYFRIGTTEVIANGSKELRLQSLFTPNYKAAIPTKEESRSPSAKTWIDLLGFFNQWLVWLKSEVEQSDLWAEMEQAPYMFADETDIVDEPFTADEIKLLGGRVSDVEQNIIVLGLPPQSQASIIEAIRKVPERASRLTKREVVNDFAGSLVKEGFKWNLDTNEMDAVWHSFQSFFILLLK